MSVASQFLTSNLRMVLLPVLSNAVVLSFMVWWVGCAVFLYSVGEVKYNPYSFISDVEFDDKTHYAMYYFFFVGLWVMSFIGGIQVFVVCATVAQFYFSGAAAAQDGG